MVFGTIDEITTKNNSQLKALQGFSKVLASDVIRAAGDTRWHRATLRSPERRFSTLIPFSEKRYTVCRVTLP
jgi:hypothetical protein